MPIALLINFSVAIPCRKTSSKTVVSSLLSYGVDWIRRTLSHPRARRAIHLCVDCNNPGMRIHNMSMAKAHGQERRDAAVHSLSPLRPCHWKPIVTRHLEIRLGLVFAGRHQRLCEAAWCGELSHINLVTAVRVENAPHCFDGLRHGTDLADGLKLIRLD